jgi:excisionase family DNA binding protein
VRYIELTKFKKLDNFLIFVYNRAMSDRREHKNEAIENILRLRRAERLADTGLSEELASVREFLERGVGRTVRLAEAARVLGISQPALSRWIDKGEISAVMTPQGRHEIPLSELVDLLDEVERARSEGRGRPLASVIRERRRRSAEAIDLDRLLPRKRNRGHRTAELHGLAYHRLIAERLDDQIVDEARRRLRRWRESGRVHTRWADEWERILALPEPRIARAISADTPSGRELRQTSPFAGLLTEQERRGLVKAIEERA